MPLPRLPRAGRPARRALRRRPRGVGGRHPAAPGGVHLAQPAARRLCPEHPRPAGFRGTGSRQVTGCPVPPFLHLSHGRRTTPPRCAVRLSGCRGGHGATSFPPRPWGQQPWSSAARCLPCSRGAPVGVASAHRGRHRPCRPSLRCGPAEEGSGCEPPGVAARALRGHCTRAPAGGGRAPRAGRAPSPEARPWRVDGGGLRVSLHKGRGAARPSAGAERQMSPSRHHEQGERRGPVLSQLDLPSACPHVALQSLGWGQCAAGIGATQAAPAPRRGNRGRGQAACSGPHACSSHGPWTGRPPPGSACGDICHGGLVRSRHLQGCELWGLELPSRGPGSRTFSPRRRRRPGLGAGASSFCEVQTPGRESQTQPGTTPQTALQSPGAVEEAGQTRACLGRGTPLPAPPASLQ